MPKSKTVTRSAKTGQFVAKSKAKTSPSTTVTEKIPAGGSGGTKTAYRSAKTGQFVKEAYAAKHPATTLKEKV